MRPRAHQPACHRLGLRHVCRKMAECPRPATRPLLLAASPAAAVSLTRAPFWAHCLRASGVRTRAAASAGGPLLHRQSCKVTVWELACVRGVCACSWGTS